MSRRSPSPGTPVMALALAGAITTALPACAGPSSPEHHRLEIRGLAFHPTALAAVPGDTMTWVNRDVVPHTVTGSGWGSGELPPGKSFTWVVEEAGEEYSCLYHPGMTGTLLPPAP